MTDQAMAREELDKHSLPMTAGGKTTWHHYYACKQVDTVIAALRKELAGLKEWKTIVLGTGTDQEAVIRMAATEYTQTAVQCWKDENEKLREALEKAKQDANLLRRQSQEVQACLTDDECPTWDDPCSVQVEDAMALRKDRDRMREKLAQAKADCERYQILLKGAKARIAMLKGQP